MRVGRELVTQADTEDCAVGGNAVATEEWSFVCYAWTKSSRRLLVYANGEANVFTGIALVDTKLRDMTVGWNPFGGTSTRARFSGTLDEVAIWTRALTESEMDLLYQGGEGCRIL